MARFARIALLLTLVAGIALPCAAAAPPDDGRSSIIARTHDLLTRLWEPFSRLFGISDAPGGPHSDPDGIAPRSHATAVPPNTSIRSNHAESEGGPNSDPNGFGGSGGGATPPPNTSGTGGNSESDGGPHSDPNG